MGGWLSRSWIGRGWACLRRPSPRWALGSLLGLGLLAGAAGWAGFTFVVAETNTLAFCTSCHAMQAYVFKEYQQSKHYKNHAGVRAVCADCHVPRAMIPKLWRKTQATFNELPKQVLGSIDRREDFEARRPIMAEHVWAQMKANDSRECRECHNATAMALSAQKPRARGQHEAAQLEAASGSGETCIDCHKGVAHELPKGNEPAATEAAEDDFSL